MHRAEEAIFNTLVELNRKQMMLQMTKAMILPGDCVGGVWAKSVGVWQVIVAVFAVVFGVMCG